jgi:quercetin dioxygenase-like cupin family protein
MRCHNRINLHQPTPHHTMSTTQINLGQLGVRYLVDGSQTASLGMFELTVPPASNVPPPHSHTNNEEIVYVLEGTLRYTVGSETRDLTAGQSMQTPKGTVHAFSNPFGKVARALIMMSPDIGAQYFKDVAAIVNAGGPPDKAALVSVMSRYGLVPSALN